MEFNLELEPIIGMFDIGDSDCFLLIESFDGEGYQISKCKIDGSEEAIILKQFTPKDKEELNGIIERLHGLELAVLELK